MIVSGIVVIVVSVLGGTIGTAMLGSGIGFSQFERDVAFDGPGDRLVPGTLSFSVLEPLDESNADMTVGVALSDDSTPEPDCALADVDGDLLRGWLEQAAKDAGLRTRRLPDALRLRSRGNLQFAFNYGSSALALPFSLQSACVLGGPELPPAGVAAWPVQGAAP